MKSQTESPQGRKVEMPSDKDMLVEARELLSAIDYSQRAGYAKQLLRTLANEVEQLRAENANAANLMRDKCVEKVKAMTDGFTVEPVTGQLISDPDGPWFLKSEIASQLESLTLDQEQEASK